MMSEKKRPSGQPCLVSVHDVYPEHLGRISGIVQALSDRSIRPFSLLVVPGRSWQREDIARLKTFLTRGGVLAAHGWNHRITRFNGMYHRLHGLFLSRREAEHLALTRAEMVERIRKGYHWFRQNGLETPRLYVPPAWAPGAVDRKTLKQLPYRFFETLGGVYDRKTDRFQPMALCGYQADSGYTERALRLNNTLNRRLKGLPLRIAIHPADFQLRLAGQLRCDLDQWGEAGRFFVPEKMPAGPPFI